MTGLPTLRMLDGAATARIWLATEPQDMRCGFDRLAERARQVTEQDPLGGHLFVFRSRRGKRASLCILSFESREPKSLNVVQGREVAWPS